MIFSLIFNDIIFPFFDKSQYITTQNKIQCIFQILHNL